MRMPFEVDFISSNEDESGAVVPIPAAPVDGKVFWPNVMREKNEKEKVMGRNAFFIKKFYPKLLRLNAVVNHINK